MSASSNVYVAGVGYSAASQGGSSGKTASTRLISAATKALLDAGVTYDDVTRTVRGKGLSQGTEALNAFGGGVPVREVEDGKELNSSFTLVCESGEQCVLVIMANEAGTMALVLVSNSFMRRWPYLKDSAALLSQSDASGSQSRSQKDQGPQQVCHIVWDLRGWTNSKDSGRQARRMHYLESSGHGFEVSRADGQSVPKWKDVEHRQDGRHRLGYNPAVENREIYQEEFEAVQASAKDGARTRSARFDREGGDRAILNRQQRYLAKL